MAKERTKKHRIGGKLRRNMRESAKLHDTETLRARTLDFDEIPLTSSQSSIPTLTDLVVEGDREIIDALRRRVLDDLSSADSTPMAVIQGPDSSSHAVEFISLGDTPPPHQGETSLISEPEQQHLDEVNADIINLDYDSGFFKDQGLNRKRASNEPTIVAAEDSRDGFDVPESLDLDALYDPEQTPNDPTETEKRVLPQNLFEFLVARINERLSTQIEQLIRDAMTELQAAQISIVMDKIQDQLAPMIETQLSALTDQKAATPNESDFEAAQPKSA